MVCVVNIRRGAIIRTSRTCKAAYWLQTHTFYSNVHLFLFVCFEFVNCVTDMGCLSPCTGWIINHTWHHKACQPKPVGVCVNNYRCGNHFFQNIVTLRRSRLGSERHWCSVNYDYNIIYIHNILYYNVRASAWCTHTRHIVCVVESWTCSQYFGRPFVQQ